MNITAVNTYKSKKLFLLMLFMIHKSKNSTCRKQLKLISYSQLKSTLTFRTRPKVFVFFCFFLLMFAMKWIHFGGLPKFEGDKTLERNDYFLTRKHSILGAAATFRLRHAMGSKNYFDRWWFMINESLFFGCKLRISYSL